MLFQGFALFYLGLEGRDITGRDILFVTLAGLSPSVVEIRFAPHHLFGNAPLGNREICSSSLAIWAGISLEHIGSLPSRILYPIAPKRKEDNRGIIRMFSVEEALYSRPGAAKTALPEICAGWPEPFLRRKGESRFLEGRLSGCPLHHPGFLFRWSVAGSLLYITVSHGRSVLSLEWYRYRRCAGELGRGVRDRAEARGPQPPALQPHRRRPQPPALGLGNGG